MSGRPIGQPRGAEGPGCPIGAARRPVEEGWAYLPAPVGWWLKRRSLETGDWWYEPVALWATRGDGEVRPVVVGIDADGLDRGIVPVDPRAPDVEAIVWDPKAADRRARGYVDVRQT